MKYSISVSSRTDFNAALFQRYIIARLFADKLPGRLIASRTGIVEGDAGTGDAKEGGVGTGGKIIGRTRHREIGSVGAAGYSQRSRSPPGV